MANIVTFLRLISPSAGFATHAHTHARKRKILFYLTATPTADAGGNYDQA